MMFNIVKFTTYIFCVFFLVWCSGVVFQSCCLLSGCRLFYVFLFLCYRLYEYVCSSIQ